MALCSGFAQLDTFNVEDTAQIKAPTRSDTYARLRREGILRLAAEIFKRFCGIHDSMTCPEHDVIARTSCESLIRSSDDIADKITWLATLLIPGYVTWDWGANIACTANGGTTIEIRTPSSFWRSKSNTSTTAPVLDLHTFQSQYHFDDIDGSIIYYNY
jgi:hypothetical protein